MLSLELKKEAFNFHYNLVKSWLLKYRDSGIYIRKINNQNTTINIPIAFINFLSNSNIEILTSGNQSELMSIYRDFIALDLSQADSLIVKDLFLKTGYTNWFQKKNGNEFLNKIGQDTCTYCNRNYTISIIKERTRAELDHWFPKDKYYILALSFYNLIPSCHSCNHSKGNQSQIIWENEFDYYSHPYFNKDDKFKFSFDYNSLIDYNVIINAKDESKIKKTLEEFKIDKIYNAHSNKELKDLLDLRYKYSDNYIDILLNKTFKNVSMSKEEIYRIVFGIETEEKDYHKRPFSKFKHDIIEELKNIK